jgi:hypothetical protein
MKSFGSIFAVLMLIVVVFTSMQIIGEESIDNSNLDSESVTLILNVSNNLNSNFNIESSFTESSSSLSENSSFDSADVFAQEFLESKSQGQQKQGLVKNIVKIPDLIILSLGIPEESVSWIKGFLLLIITVILSFASYRAFFGGGKITDN